VTPEEAAARIAADKARLQDLEAEVTRLASAHATPVVLAMLRALVEMVCASQGPLFATHNKTKFYTGVLLMLRDKGIS
jgi:hypothetical protein